MMCEVNDVWQAIKLKVNMFGAHYGSVHFISMYFTP